MSSLFGSITIKGNRLTDLVGQTSTVGKPIPFGYGRCKITEPNVIWTAGIPKEHVKKKKQGKGGVKTEEYTYTLSYAIAFMAGPVYGYLTIKRGGKVVFTTDPNASVEDQAYAAKWQQKAKLYLGTRTQMPDSTIESYKGAGQVSAFRDLAYIVVEDDDVTAEGGAVPQYEAVIIASPPNVYLTSQPYAVEDIEDLGAVASFYRMKPDPDLIVDDLMASASFIGVTLIPTVIYSTYNMPQEDNIAAAISLQNVNITQVAAYTTYNHPQEDNISAAASLQGVTMVVTAGYVSYDIGTESITASASLVGVTLS